MRERKRARGNLRHYIMAGCASVFMAVVFWLGTENSGFSVNAAAIVEYKDEAIYKVGNSFRDKNGNYLLKQGDTMRFTASLAHYSDGVIACDWRVTNSSILQITGSRSGTLTQTVRGVRPGVAQLIGAVRSIYSGPNYTYDDRTMDNPFPIRVVAPLSGATLSHTQMTLAPGTTGKLDLMTITPDSAYSLFVTDFGYVSSDPTVATIDSTGNIQALRNGTTTLSFNGDGRALASCVLTVSDGKEPAQNENPSGNKDGTAANAQKSGLSISATDVTLKVGEKFNLSTWFNGKTVRPTFVFGNGNKNSISITKKGKITARQSGVIKIKVKHKNQTQKCRIKVVPADVSVKNVKIKGKKVTLRWKKTSNLTGYKIYVSDAENGVYRQVKKVKGGKKKVVLKNQTPGTHYYKIQSFKKSQGKTYESDLTRAIRVQIGG